jgi:TonB-linked SusC/RagA family outer membrane protein
MNKQMFDQKKRGKSFMFITLFFICLLCSLQLQAQSIRISGIVKDASGEALVGTTVVQKNNLKNGTITDVNGSFQLTVPKGAILVFSNIGYKTKEATVTGKSMSIVLVEDNKALDEVVVIGYGSVKKQNLTSSISKIGPDAIKDRPVTSMADAFSGQLSGVRAQQESGVPGAEPTIRIRGINTINGDSSPLYVIDGVPRDNMSDINPTDVASVQILKDAAATSIYGSRGANGVILIETKQGKGKPTITFDGYYGFQSPNKMMDMMNGDEWVAYMTYARNERYIRNGGKMSDPMSMRSISDRIPASWTDGSRPYVDWGDVILHKGAAIQSYQVSASSKGDIGSIYVSGGYMSQDGVIKETDYDRTNLRINGTMNIGKNLRVGVNIAPSVSNQHMQKAEGKENIIHRALMQSPLIQLDEATIKWGYPSDFSQVYTNSLQLLQRLVDKNDNTKVLSSVWGEYNIMKDLVFKTQYSYDYFENKYEYFLPVLDRNFTPGGTNTITRKTDWAIQNTLSYEKTIGDGHNFSLLLGQSADKHHTYMLTASKTGYPNEMVTTLNVATTPTGASSVKTSYATASFFGRLAYNYKEKYLFSASIRRDGSSRFGTNNKWGTFPSASIGWKINQEKFMQNVPWVSLLKVRASWGKAGNDRIGNYDYMALMDVKNAVWNNTLMSGLAPSYIANDNLKWETTTTRDLGLDVSLFNNRVQLNIDYYNNKTTDLLFNKPIPLTTGFSSYRTNVGSIQNRGWDIDINTFNINNKDFKWNTSINLSSVKNKVLDMGGDQRMISTYWDAQFITQIGKPVCQYYIYRTDGVLTAKDFDANGNALVPIMAGQVEGNYKYVNQNDDKVINTADLVPYGNPLPDLMYGITNTFSYKGLELRIFLQGQVGGNVLWLGARQMDMGSSSVNSLSRWVHCYKPDYVSKYGENPIPNINGVDMSWDGKTPYTLAGKNDNNSNFRIYSASFFKIKNITLSYTLPKSWLKRIAIQSAKFYFSVDNLAQFDNYPGITPESNTFGNQATQQGIDYCTYPISKRFVIGTSLTF